MKKLYKPILIFFISLIFLGFNSCDILEKLFLNLKVSEEFNADGDESEILDSIVVCLTDYDAFKDNFDEIQSLKYVNAAYYSLEWTPSNLGGNNISAVLYDCDGKIILTQNMTKALASDYFEDPYEFTLTQDEIEKFNQYLSNYKECDCFSAVLRIKPVTPPNNPPYTLKGVVEIIIEIEAKL